MNAKIFGIGLSKTGTSSLHTALEILGYRSVHFPISMGEIEHHDAASDISISYRFKELDLLYPNSKFILTTRELNQWLDSCENHFYRQVNLSELPPRLRDFLCANRLLNYGTTSYNRSIFEEAYQRHIQDVKDYFTHRLQDLLIMNIEEGWDRLCPFLGRSIPDQAFPQENVACESLDERFRDMIRRLESITEPVA